jgi:AcrR family transcriptional regulator
MKDIKNPKERLLETASKLFYTQGYNETGINQILEEANVAKASLYLHFGSKEDLGVEYIKGVREEWFSSLNNFIYAKRKPKEQILAIFDFLDINMKKNSFQGCRFLNLLTEIDNKSNKIQNQVVEHKAKLRMLFSSLTSQIEESLIIPNPGDILYLLFEGAIVEAKVYKENWPITTARQAAKTLLTGKT